MNPILVLRAELVCLIILLYLTFVSRTYRMGKDVRIFNQILFFSILHVIMDIVTVYTVNHTETIPLFINNLAHMVFYLSAIMYSYEMCMYTLNLSRPQQMNRTKRILALVPVLPVLTLAILAGIGTLKLIEERHLFTSRYCSAHGRQG